MIRFASKGHSIEVREIETLPLQYGGGAPSAASPENMQSLKTALKKLTDKDVILGSLARRCARGGAKL